MTAPRQVIVRRLARIAIDPKLVGALLGLPPELKPITAQYDADSDTVNLIVEGEHLPATELGYVIPRITPVHVDEIADGERRTNICAIYGYEGPFTPRVLRVEKIPATPQDDSSGDASRVLGGTATC
jgi:hypothetical protein